MGGWKTGQKAKHSQHSPTYLRMETGNIWSTLTFVWGCQTGHRGCRERIYMVEGLVWTPPETYPWSWDAPLAALLHILSAGRPEQRQAWHRLSQWNLHHNAYWLIIRWSGCNYSFWFFFTKRKGPWNHKTGRFWCKKKVWNKYPFSWII